MPRPRDPLGDINLRSRPQLCEYQAVVDRVMSDGGLRVLDWGCGWGQVSHMLLDRGLEVSSLEFRPDSREGEVETLERFPDVRALLTPDDVALPYPDNSFDAALSLGVLEHVREPAASLQELRRVLIPGGRLYIYKLPNRNSYLEWLARHLGMYYHGQAPHDQVYTLGSAVSLVASQGFDVLEARRTNMLPLTLPGRLAARLSSALWIANRTLSRLPLLNGLATNIELVARGR